MTIPVKERFFEDYVAGESLSYGDYLMTEQEIIEFATRFDPQAFHIDPVAARQSSFAGLAASGWHTASASMRMLVDHFILRRRCAERAPPTITSCTLASASDSAISRPGEPLTTCQRSGSSGKQVIHSASWRSAFSQASVRVAA